MSAETLLSVGIDLGTTTTQLVFSRLTVRNEGSAFSVPNYTVAAREVLRRSAVHFTPLRSERELDAEAIARYDPFSSHNNIRVTATYEDGSGEGELIVTRESLNPHGIVHGGCLAALADSVGGWAAASAQPPTRQMETQNIPSRMTAAPTSSST